MAMTLLFILLPSCLSGLFLRSLYSWTFVSRTLPLIDQMDLHPLFYGWIVQLRDAGSPIDAMWPHPRWT